MSAGTVYGVGLGPGDPDLMSVRADRLVREAKNIAYFRKKGRMGQARQIVEGMLRPDVNEFAMEYPVTTEIPVDDPRYNEILAEFYESCTSYLRQLSRLEEDVVVLCEGDPFFYGSFMHLYSRVKGKVPVEVVPAITGMSGAWTATGQPITWGDDVLTVLAGTLSEYELTKRMAETDAIVVMKIGRNMEKVCRSLKASGKYDDAWLVEYATMHQQTVRKVIDIKEEIAPYCAIIVVHGQGRRP